MKQIVQEFPELSVVGVFITTSQRLTDTHKVLVLIAERKIPSCNRAKMVADMKDKARKISKKHMTNRSMITFIVTKKISPVRRKCQFL